MNLLGENPAIELEDINQENADLQKDILAGVKAHWDVTELVEKVQELRSRKTEIEAGWTAEKRNKERIDNLRESIDFQSHLKEDKIGIPRYKSEVITLSVDSLRPRHRADPAQSSAIFLVPKAYIPPSAGSADTRCGRSIYLLPAP